MVPMALQTRGKSSMIEAKSVFSNTAVLPPAFDERPVRVYDFPSPWSFRVDLRAVPVCARSDRAVEIESRGKKLIVRPVCVGDLPFVPDQPINLSRVPEGSPFKLAVRLLLQ